MTCDDQWKPNIMNKTIPSKPNAITQRVVYYACLGLCKYMAQYMNLSTSCWS